MITLTTEQAQQIEEIVEHLLVDHPTARHHKACVEALSIIRAARAQEQAEQEPLLWEDDKFAPHERPQKQEPVVDPYNGDDGPGFDYKFHEKLKAGLHLMSFGEQKLWNAGWDAAKAFYAAPVQ